MRRKDKEITDKTLMEDILNRSELVRLAMVDGGEPYVVTLNYVYKDNALYIHSAPEGRKIDILRRNNRVAFTVDTDVSLYLGKEACDCTTHYKSVFGTGEAFFVEGLEEKAHALDWLMVKHGGQGNNAYPESLLGRTAILRIAIESLTGKKSGF